MIQPWCLLEHPGVQKWTVSRFAVWNQQQTIHSVYWSQLWKFSMRNISSPQNKGKKNPILRLCNFKFLISHPCVKSTDQFFQDTRREGNHCFYWTTVICSKCDLCSLSGLIETPSFLLEYLPEDFTQSGITKWQKEKRREKMFISMRTSVLKLLKSMP